MKLSDFEVKQFAFVSKAIRIIPKDVIDFDDCLIVVVKPGEAGKAIGKDAKNVHQLKKGIGKHITVVEFSTDLNLFVSNLLKPVKVKNVVLDDGIVRIGLSTNDKFKVGKRKVELVKTVLQRHFSVSDVKTVFN